MGSWPNKLSVKPKDGERFGVDVGVVMPEVCLDTLFLKFECAEGEVFRIFRTCFRRRII